MYIYICIYVYMYMHTYIMFIGRSGSGGSVPPV